MEAMSGEARRRAGEAEAAIFQAYALSLSDPALIQRAREVLAERSVPAETAWSLAVGTFLELYEKLESPYMKARSRDLADLLNQVLLELSGGGGAYEELTEPAVVLADEPTANLDSETGHRIVDLMRQINETEKTTFIFSTHDSHIMEHARRVVSIRDGRFTGEELKG